MTRSQRYLILAEDLVTQVATAHPEGSEERKIYGGLCHNFPILVRTGGLCQALAFSASKAGGDTPRKRAHQFLLDHVAAILEVQNGDPLTAVRRAPTARYMRDTRQVLQAWIYFKRFAVSILKVDDGRGAEGGENA